MITLALLALVASVLVWASPSSQAQANISPIAGAGADDTVAPGSTVNLNGSGSFDPDDADCAAATPTCTFKWEVVDGPYDWIAITNDTQAGDGNAGGPSFSVPSQAFIDKVRDDDPQKYEIVVELTVTDAAGASDTDTVTYSLNQRPTADIQLFAGLRDPSVVDTEATLAERYSISAVIDGPGENGNRDNEWDVMEGALLILNGSGSTDPDNANGMPAAYQWDRLTIQTSGNPTPATTNYVNDTPTSDTDFSATQRQLVVGTEVRDSGGTNQAPSAADVTAGATGLLPLFANAGQSVTIYYQLNVCDELDAGAVTCGSTGNGLEGTAVIKIVVHDSSIAPKVKIEAGLSTASAGRGDAEPQATVGQITGVDNQFIVAAGSTVTLTANVTDRDQPGYMAADLNASPPRSRPTYTTAHTYVWSGANAGTTDRSIATVRVPRDADDGDTIAVTLTVTDSSRASVEVPIELKVGTNAEPTAGGVPTNGEGIPGVIGRSSYSDGVQKDSSGVPLKTGATVTLRGVGNDADGDSLIHAWVQREAPADFGTLMDTARAAFLTAAQLPQSTATERQARGLAIGQALQPLGLADLKEPERPLLELEGTLTDTVSFDVPELKKGDATKGTILIFTVIDSNGASDSQLIYIEVTNEDDVPTADAGDDQQVDPGSFVRLNGSNSSDPDAGEGISHSWAFTGATMDPAPDERSPLSAAEIKELDGWILTDNGDGTFDYIVNAAGEVTGTSTNLKAGDSAYPYFDAPDLTGFNNIKLTFTLTVTDNDDDPRFELNGNLIDPATGEAYDPNGADPETAPAPGESDTDTVTITIVNRYFSGNIPGPDFCTNRSLGGPQTYPLDSDKDGVADTCSLNTTRRATVARQNALETLANLNPTEFRNAVNAVCNAPGFKQAPYGDDPEDLKTDACETGRVSPPPVEVDPAEADVFYSGTITGPDFCTNHSLGGARTYAYDSDDDGVADVCSLSTTRREAIARQNGLNSFIVSFSAAEQTELTERERLVELEDTDPDPTGDELTELQGLRAKYGANTRTDDGAAELTADERTAVDARITALTDKQSNANRYSNAVDAACRALGSQDFGDAASALARDACAPKSGPTGTPLS